MRSSTARRRAAGRALPARLANSVSPAQNDGSIGVTGDCSVAKNPVMSGSDSTRSSRSGLMNRSSSTMLPANTRPISIRMSRARRAGKTFTSSSVVPRSQRHGNDAERRRPSAAPSRRTGTARSARCRRRAAPAAGRRRPSRTTGAASSRTGRRTAAAPRSARRAAACRSSDRKNVDSAVTTPLKARNDRNVRKSHDKPMRSRKSPSSS